METNMRGPTDDIRFERFERDVQYNRDRRAEGELRYLIYDFRVMIAGEHRATLWRDSIGRQGYNLRDADGRPIPDRDSSHEHIGAEVSRQSDFFQFVQDRLSRIPSATGLAELRCADAILEIQVRHYARERILAGRLQMRAPVLLTQLVNLTRQVRQSLDKRLVRSDWDKPVEKTLRIVETFLTEINDAPIDPDDLQSTVWDIRRGLREAVL